MSITFSLKINDLRVVQLEDKPNTVCQIDYEYIGVNADNKAHSYIGTERLDTEGIESFVAFDDLTQEMVVDWLESIWSDTHYTHMEEQITARFDIPVITSARKPWEPVPDDGAVAP